MSYFFKVAQKLIILPSQPQIAYELIEAWGAEGILQGQGLSIDGPNNSKDTTIQ